MKKRYLSLNCNSGSILILCIWSLVILSLLSVGLYRISTAQLSIYKRLRERVVSRYLAKAAFQYARVLRCNDLTEYDSLIELRTERAQELGHGAVSFVFIDEESKININTASQEVLRLLLDGDGGSAESIIASGRRPFHVKEELLLVDGITQELFDSIKGLITVYGGGQVNINTADKQILIALGMDSSLADTIEKYRAGGDGEECTDDDQAFERTEDIISSLTTFFGLSPGQTELVTELINNKAINVSSENFSLKVNAKFLDKPTISYTIVMDKEKIKQWSEH